LVCGCDGLLRDIGSTTRGHQLCIECGINKCKKSITKTHEIFSKQVNEMHNGNFEIIDGIYKNNKYLLTFNCKKHNISFKYRPDRFIRGHIGCPKCQPIGWSRAAQEWIESVERAEGIHIQHKPRDSREKVVGGYKVDGWCEETQTIYEFHGDYWHGNPKIYQWRMDEVNMSNGKTFGQLYDETCKKTQHLRSLGYRVIEKWETSSM
jgi:hypothetical protein